jgi:signal transduction histidine kinase
MPHRRRNAEEEERERQERLAYVGALAAGLVHEVRNPLHAIQLNTQLLVEDVDTLPAEQRASFERRAKRIYTEVNGLTRTLEAFLTFARPPRLEPTPTDLNRFLRELIEFVTPEFEEDGIEIEYDLATDMYPVVLDQSQFTHVVLNLLRNAREAIDERQAREDAPVDGRVYVHTEETETTVSLSVEDNGTGVEPGDEERIFEVFYTTKQKGTGLGLGIVRRIVEDHRGTITVETDRPVGALFMVTLPRGRFLEFREEE